MERIKCTRCKGTGIDPELPNNEPCIKCSGLKKLDWVENITGVELTRTDKTILFVIQSLNELAEIGIITGGGLNIDERAKEIIKDFKPTGDEIREVILSLKRQGFIA